jgi:hypothetical protein
MWRTHLCVPCRDSSRHPVDARRILCRHKCRHGTQECVRHIGSNNAPEILGERPLLVDPLRFGNESRCASDFRDFFGIELV